MDRAINAIQRLTNMHTPETDVLYEHLLKENPGNLIYLEEMLELARKLEQERDEAREAFKISYNERVKAELERDEARAELAEWTDSALNARKEYDDEHHCSCVAILRKLLKDAERERDEWAAMCGRYKQERDEAREQRGPGAAPHRKN
jgi:predicted Zn-dependent protease